MEKMRRPGVFPSNLRGQPSYMSENGWISSWPSLIYPNGRVFMPVANIVPGHHCPPFSAMPGRPETPLDNGRAWFQPQPPPRSRKRPPRKQILLTPPQPSEKRCDDSVPGSTLSSGSVQPDINQALATPKARSNTADAQATAKPSPQNTEDNGDDGKLSLFIRAGVIRATLTRL